MKKSILAATMGMVLTMLLLWSGEASAQQLSFTGASSRSASNWLAGAVAGYNWHHGSLLYGIETDFQATKLATSTNSSLQYSGPVEFYFGPKGPSDVAVARSSVDWYGTVRGRLGTIVGPAFLYLTGGLAYGKVDLSSTLAALGLATNAETQPIRFGGVVGAGLDYLVVPNVMLTFQYQYVDLGRVSVASAAANWGEINQSVTAHAQIQTAMLGLSYRFVPDGSPSPWAGAYAGIHGGGAWGDNNSATYGGSVLLVP